jgi:hypothetical protein
VAAFLHKSKNRMNREIKFRAWDKSQKYMAYQGNPDLETIQSFMHHFGDKKLMMSTGIYDANYNEIFESDIIQTPKGLAQVKFELGCYYVSTVSRYRLGGWHKESIIKIGNIYENADLLQGFR